MKLKLVSILLVCFMASGVYATNSWVGPSGSWGTASLWGSGHTPIDSDTDIKICKNNVTSCDLDVAAGTFETAKVTLGGNSSYNIAFNITPSGSISIGKEFRVGDSGVGGQGPYGKAIQTGGSVVLNTSTNTGKLEIGYKTGYGWYIISGGSISGTGGMSVGSSVGSSGGVSGGTGKFTVQGNGSSVSVGNLFVGTSDAAETYTGTGTLEFQIVSGAVTAIWAGNVYIDPTNTSASVANLLVSITSGTPVGNILLVNNTGNAVTGSFDALNGGSAIEGAVVALGGNAYILTYMYDSVSGTIGSERSATYNDIALIPVPGITILTPATNTGDLLIAAVATDGDTSGSIAPVDQGWNEIDIDAYSGEVTLAAWWKLAGDSEPATHTFSWSRTNPQQAYGWMMRFTGHDAASPINNSSYSNDLSSTPTSPEVTTTVDNCIILRLGAFDDNDVTVDNPGLSGHTAITMDESGGSAGGTISGGAGYVKQATAGSSGTSTFTLGSSNEARMLTIAIAPDSNTSGEVGIRP